MLLKTLTMSVSVPVIQSSLFLIIDPGACLTVNMSSVKKAHGYRWFTTDVRAEEFTFPWSLFTIRS